MPLPGHSGTVVATPPISLNTSRRAGLDQALFLVISGSTGTAILYLRLGGAGEFGDGERLVAQQQGDAGGLSHCATVSAINGECW